MQYREGTDIEALTKLVFELANKTRGAADHILKHVRTYLLEIKTPLMEPRDRKDWRAVDVKIATIYMLQSQADTEYSNHMIVIGLTGFNAENMDKMYYMLNYKLALEAILMSHAKFMVDGIYRDENADWYYDRLYSHVETAVKEGVKVRDKGIGEALAKVRCADRQDAGKGSGDPRG
jgi:hypothetical protein